MHSIAKSIVLSLIPLRQRAHKPKRQMRCVHKGFATPGLGLLARRTLATRISQGAAGDSGLHVERVFLPDDVPNIAP